MVIQDPIEVPDCSPGLEVASEPQCNHTSVGEPETLRQIRIQSGVLSRVMKEHCFYVEDAEKLLKQIASMKERGECEHDIKRMSEIFVETKKMIPHALNQVDSSRIKLGKLLEGIQTSSILAECDTLMERANAILNTSPSLPQRCLDDDESDVSEF
jgi:hypothetical protein